MTRHTTPQVPRQRGTAASPSRGLRLIAPVGLLVAALLALVACDGGEAELTREPHSVAAPAEADTAGLWLPMSMSTMRIVDPAWDSLPQQLAGTFLGTATEGDVVEFTAVDESGETLWAVERPTDHAGFALTLDADGRALAVLTDRADPGDASARTTATAYDLTTGAPVWGPVDVPGPHRGPGLVFGPAGSDAGETVALDASSGSVGAQHGDAADLSIVGEYAGVLLLSNGESLTASRSDAPDDGALWTVALADHGWDQALAPTAASGTRTTDPGTMGTTAQSGVVTPGLALVETSSSTRALIALDDGTVAADDVLDTAVDPTTGTRVILGANGGLHARDASGQDLWSLTVAPGTTMAALGGVFLYLRDGDAVRVHNVMTGAVAEVYAPDGTGRIVVPAQIATTGAAVLPDGERYLLATTTSVPGQSTPPQTPPAQEDTESP